jgi:hypothetical protein
LIFPHPAGGMVGTLPDCAAAIAAPSEDVIRDGRTVGYNAVTGAVMVRMT